MGEGRRITYKTIDASAIICSNAVVARATIETRIRPALVPINLAMNSRITVDTITRIGAEWSMENLQNRSK